MRKIDFMSERIIFGILIIGGYYVLAGIVLNNAKLTEDQRQLARDMILVLGPLLGVIVNAIWKNDKVDRINADTASTLASKTPDLSSGVPAGPLGVVDAANSGIAKGDIGVTLDKLPEEPKT